MPKHVAIIENPDRTSYDRSYVEDSTGDIYQFVTNFDKNLLPIYLEAIEEYEGPIEFGICEKAYGFYEDEGTSFLVPDLSGLYMKNIPDEGTGDFFNLVS